MWEYLIIILIAFESLGNIRLKYNYANLIGSVGFQGNDGLRIYTVSIIFGNSIDKLLSCKPKRAVYRSGAGGRAKIWIQEWYS